MIMIILVITTKKSNNNRNKDTYNQITIMIMIMMFLWIKIRLTICLTRQEMNRQIKRHIDRYMRVVCTEIRLDISQLNYLLIQQLSELFCYISSPVQHFPTSNIRFRVEGVSCHSYNSISGFNLQYLAILLNTYGIKNIVSFLTHQENSGC